MKSQEIKFCVLDIETTGLDIYSDILLEIGAILLDKDLNEIDTFTAVAADRTSASLMRHRAQFDDNAKYVYDMHERSGLIHEIEINPADGPISDVALVNEFSSWLDEHGLYIPALSTRNGEVYVMGSSVHFDMDFMTRYQSRFPKRFHYRRLDVSSIKVMLENLFPQSYKESRGKFFQVSRHRALNDCRDTIKELSVYRDLFGEVGLK